MDSIPNDLLRYIIEFCGDNNKNFTLIRLVNKQWCDLVSSTIISVRLHLTGFLDDASKFKGKKSIVF